MPDNFTNDNTELLIQYMDNELNDTDSKSVQQRLSSDEKLNEQYQYLLAAKQSIQAQGFKQRIQSIQNEFLNERKENTQPAKVVKSNTFFKTFMRVAAMFILAVAGFGIYEFATVSTQSVYSENFIAYQLPVNRSNESIDKVNNLYAEGKYADVISNINLKQQKTQQDYFLAAQSYLQLNKPTEAINNFKAVEDLNNKSNSKYFVEETDYYLALAYIKNGNINLAQQQLYKIEADKNHLFYNNAKKISAMQLKVLELKNGK